MTLHNKNHDWKQMPTGNMILSNKKFMVSYNPDTNNGHTMFTQLGNMFGLDLKDGEETALTNKETDTWYVLEGDFRKEYEEAYPKGLEACLEVYKAHLDKRSNWSTDPLPREEEDK